MGKKENNYLCSQSCYFKIMLYYLTSNMFQENEETMLVPGWNIPVYVKNFKDSEILKNFMKIEIMKIENFPKKNDENNYDNTIKKCQQRRFKFPGFPETLGSNHLE